jgi:putative FmdB family regulatory protein
MSSMNSGSRAAPAGEQARTFGEVKAMATYDYRCQDCGEEFTRSEHISEHASGLQGSSSALRCPKCGSQQVESIVSAAYVHTRKKS